MVSHLVSEEYYFTAGEEIPVRNSGVSVKTLKVNAYKSSQNILTTYM